VQNKKVMTREQAIERGATRYYTGGPCRHGHDAERYTLNGSCVTCTREAKIEHNKRVLEKRAAVKLAQG
jgi:hypothetical protein